MRDKTHDDQIERWAMYVKTHPREDWIKHLKPLVDSQLIKANSFLKKLNKTEKGRKKIEKIKGIV